VRREPMTSITLFPIALAIAIVMGSAEMLPVAIFVALLFLVFTADFGIATRAGVLTFASEAVVMAAFLASR